MRTQLNTELCDIDCQNNKDVDRLTTLGYVIQQYFIVSDGTNNMCTHLLIVSSQGHPLIVEVKPFNHDFGIKIDSSNISIVPEKITIHYDKAIIEAKTEVCFLTHSGIDTYRIRKKSLLFLDTVKDIPKLQHGIKFYYPMPYVMASRLVCDLENDNLSKFVGDNKHLGLYRNLVKSSSNPYILDAEGPFTLYAPSDEFLEREYGKNAEMLTRSGNKEKLDSVVSSYIIPGMFDEDYSGENISLNGDPVSIEKGIPVVNSEPLLLGDKSVKKSNGYGNVIHSGKPLISSASCKDMTKCARNICISLEDIASSSYLLWKYQRMYQVEVRQSIRDYIKIMTEALDRYESQEKEIESLEDRINSLSDMNQIRILVEQYNDYIKTGSQIIAINHMLAPFVKGLRDA